MHRVISYFISVTYTFFKFSLMKFFNWNRFRFHVIERFSPDVMTDFNHRSSVDIGYGVKVRSGVKMQVRKGGTLKIGDNAKINYNCIIACHDRIEIGKKTEIGPSVYIYDHDHDYRNGLDLDQFISSPIIIGDNCWIGAQTVILRGTKIGNNCVIGAGSVLKGSYPEGSVIIQKRETLIYDGEKG